MKIYISVDMEGIAGTFSFNQEKNFRNEVRNQITEQLNWVIEGIKKSKLNNKIDEILIADSHSFGDNINYDFTSIDDRIYLISGSPRDAYMMPNLSKNYDTVFFVGYHGGIGRINASMDHTYSSSSIHKIWINNQIMNETLINAAYAGYFDIPVSLVIGDKALYDETKEYLPETKFVITKEAISRFSAKLRPKNLVKKDTIDTIVNLLSSKDNLKIPTYKFNDKIILKVELANTHITDAVSMIPYVNRLDGRTIEFACNDYKIIFNCIMAIVYVAAANKL